MGATNIVVTAKGKNMEDAFAKAQAEAQEEYGSDSYNGEINNCSLGNNVTHMLADKGEEKLIEYCYDNARKREVYGFCLKKPVANTNQTKSVVNNIPNKGSRKWETRYVAINPWDDEFTSQPNISEKTQGEAIRKAREYVSKNPGVKLNIEVTKVLTAGNTLCAEVTYKRSSTERLGTYVFAGWAPC